jgi:hypothetical protein
VAFVGRLVFGEAHVVVDAKYGVLGSEIAQRLDGIEAEDEALDEVFEERSGFFVLGAVGCKPFVVVVQAKVVQESEDGLELSHGIDFGLQGLDSFHFMRLDAGRKGERSSWNRISLYLLETMISRPFSIISFLVTPLGCSLLLLR